MQQARLYASTLISSFFLLSEPVIHGFTRSFGMRIPNGERYEWVKPIMFSAGVGQMDGGHADKGSPEMGMLVVKVGGPAYRIGIGA